MNKKASSKSKRGSKAKPSEGTQAMAMYIAMVVRNRIENFHAQYLSDQQMKELNPLIRNAICTALYASENYDRSEGAKAFVDFNVKMIPNYWEEPELTEDFLNTVRHFERNT
jgi:hypothetical protein